MGFIFSEDFLKCLLLAVYAGATVLLLVFTWTVWRCCCRSTVPQNGVNKSQPETGRLPGVSIIIAARNEAHNLQRHLPEWLDQQYDGAWELVLVDDASTDESAELLDQMEDLYPRLLRIRLKEKIHPGKKAALSAGIAAAQYGLLLLTDADCRPASRHWLAGMSAPMAQNPDIELVLGFAPMCADTGMLNGWSRFETVHTAMLYFTSAAVGMPYMGVGRNLGLRKSLFERMGGYSAHAHVPSGDDDLLVNAGAEKSNTACCYLPETFMFSRAADSWPAWLRQKNRHLSVGRAYRRQHQILLGMLGMSYTLHYFLLFFFFFAGFAWKAALLLWLVRQLLLLAVYNKVFSRLEARDLLSHFPIYDALLAVYYGAFVPYVLIGKKTHSWK